MALAQQGAWGPHLFFQTELISIAENLINKKTSRYTVDFSIYSLATMSRNLVQIFNQGCSFPTQFISCSLMRVLITLGSQRFYNYREDVLIRGTK